MKYRGGIFKLLRSPGNDSNESIPPAYVAWRSGTTTLFLFSSWPPQIVLKFQLCIEAPYSVYVAKFDARPTYSSYRMFLEYSWSLFCLHVGFN
jgi:hypothetical protein